MKFFFFIYWVEYDPSIGEDCFKKHINVDGEEAKIDFIESCWQDGHFFLFFFSNY